MRPIFTPDMAASFGAEPHADTAPGRAGPLRSMGRRGASRPNEGMVGMVVGLIADELIRIHGTVYRYRRAPENQRQLGQIIRGAVRNGVDSLRRRNVKLSFQKLETLYRMTGRAIQSRFAKGLYDGGELKRIIAATIYPHVEESMNRGTIAYTIRTRFSRNAAPARAPGRPL